MLSETAKSLWSYLTKELHTNDVKNLILNFHLMLAEQESLDSQKRSSFNQPHLFYCTLGHKGHLTQVIGQHELKNMSLCLYAFGTYLQGHAPPAVPFYAQRYVPKTYRHCTTIDFFLWSRIKVVVINLSNLLIYYIIY